MKSWRDLPGWFHFQPFYERTLRQLESGSVVVELGVYAGASLAYAAQVNKERGGDLIIHGVDLWLEFGYEGITRNLLECGVLEYVNLISDFSWDAARRFELKSVDFLFIDASHYYPHVYKDIIAWLPKMKIPAIVAGDDYGDPTHPGVKRAVDEFFSERKLATEGSVWWVDWP